MRRRQIAQQQLNKPPLENCAVGPMAQPAQAPGAVPPPPSPVAVIYQNDSGAAQRKPKLSLKKNG
jgi:hypothetical protein